MQIQIRLDRILNIKSPYFDALPLKYLVGYLILLIFLGGSVLRRVIVSHEIIAALFTAQIRIKISKCWIFSELNGLEFTVRIKTEQRCEYVKAKTDASDNKVESIIVIKLFDVFIALDTEQQKGIHSQNVNQEHNREEERHESVDHHGLMGKFVEAQEQKYGEEQSDDALTKKFLTSDNIQNCNSKLKQKQYFYGQHEPSCFLSCWDCLFSTHPNYFFLYSLVRLNKNKSPFSFIFSSIVLLMSSSFKKNIAQRYFHQALQLQDGDDAHIILILLNHATRLNPRKIAYWEALFNIATELEQYEVALKSINYLFKFKKYSNPQAQVIKSNVLFCMGKFKRSLRVLSNLKQSSIMSSSLSFLKAKCYLHMGRYQKALSLFNKVVPERQSAPSCHFFKGICYFYLEKYRIAIRFFNEAAYDDQYRFNADLLFLKGNCHYNLRQFQRALISYQEVLAVDSSYTQAQSAALLAHYRIVQLKCLKTGENQ